MVADFSSIVVYIGSVVLSMLLGWIYQKTPVLQQKYRWLSLIIICIPLSLVAGLRENVGTDYENYTEIMDAMKNYDYGSILKWETPAFIEPAFILLTKFCTSLSPDSHFLPFFAYTFLTLFFSLLGFDRFGKKVNLPLAILLFYFIYYHVFLNIIRQGIAVALLIFSIKDLVERQYLRYIIIILVAFLFHRTAILNLIFLLIPLFSGRFSVEGIYIEGTRRVSWLILFVILFSALSVTLYNSLFEYEVFLNRADFSIDETQGERGTGLGIIFFFCVNIYFIILLERKFLKQYKETAIVRDMSYVYIPVQILGYYMPYTDRLILFIDVAFLFVILFSAKDARHGKLVMWYSIFLYGYRYVSGILIQGQTETFPYHAISIF